MSSSSPTTMPPRLPPFKPSFTPRDSVASLWRGLGLPAASLDALELPVGDEGVYASSFKIAREYLLQEGQGNSGHGLYSSV